MEQAKEERRHVRLLPAAVANKIAAGEVVERPASVVKEFMENSFDAGATRVEVTIVAGGRKLISVADDGCGMERDDALLCLEPQATSKIRDVDDIERIATYGFRGEAVPSVAAVSRMILKTCARGDAAGTCVEIDGGKVRGVTEIGFPAGTTFEVRDLFFNVPARRKFLKAYATEQAHIRTAFLLQALAHPEATLKLRADGRDLVSVAGGATLEERVHDLFGAEMLDALRPVDFTNGNVTVKGFVGLPTLTRADRSEQYIFVNRRAATAAIIPYALREAYPPLDGDRKPVAILFIEVPPTEVDVNVHPTKREVRFRDARAVRDALIMGVQKALGLGGARALEGAGKDGGKAPEPPQDAGQGMAESARSDIAVGARTDSAAFRPVGAVLQTAPARGAGREVPPPSSSSYTPPPPAPQVEPAEHRSAGFPPAGNGEDAVTMPAVQQELPMPPSGEAPGLWKWCRILGQISSGYLLMETDGGYVVLDPRAAMERVLYERMLDGAQGISDPSQALLIPQTVSLPPEDAERIGANIDEVRAIGIGIDPFGDNAFIVEALPTGVSLPDIRTFLSDISHGIAEAGGKRGVADWRQKALARAAAASAATRMGPLPWPALAPLVKELAKAKMPYTSPRGNPTMLFTSIRELDRKFGHIK